MHLRHLSKDCRILLDNADDVIDINIVDPAYKVAIDLKKRT
jgi:SulP family sulfate permease